MNVLQLFIEEVVLSGNLIIRSSYSNLENQEQTNKVFSEKWKKYSESIEDKSEYYKMQEKWYLDLYGFVDEAQLSEYLSGKIVLDAGCGIGHKAAWMAKLAPNATIIGMDYSEACLIAAKEYAHIPNLYFVRGDIANTGIKSNSIDYVSCDQVIHHTEFPEKTFSHLTDITKKGGEFACYVYAKKALPRELMDDFFRGYAKKLTNQELWDLSEQLTLLGKNLSELNVSFVCPDIPSLGIKGGNYDIQRFIYWNFLKCFWNPNLGYETSKTTNFDWYSPSNAARYSEEEYKKIINNNSLSISYFHKEEACYSGRFKK